VKEKWKYSSYHFYLKTKDWIQKFLIHYGELALKIYGVSPFGLEFLPPTKNTPLTVILE